VSNGQNMISVSKLFFADDIPLVVTLAEEIWSECFTPIIGEAQVRYMLDLFQSHSAIQQQLNNGTHYYIALLDQEPVGYIAFSKEANAVFVSKLYVKSERRKQGIAKHLFSFAKAYARFGDIKKIYLTVNKRNEIAITAYKSMGFKNIADVTKEIGEGFVMDDYHLELELETDKK